MCYLCSCCAWGLDMVQRLITFGLACILSCALCIGMSIAIIAGIAYGYNYCMAEFMTFTRSDVTVYMRRGQFNDKMDLGPKRRTGEDELDLFTTNGTTDYEDRKPPADSKPLSDTWLKTQDTRKYAEILTRYSPNKRSDVVDLPPLQEPLLPDESRRSSEVFTQMPPLTKYRTPPESVISVMPNPLIPTVSWRSGSSEILMRNYNPLQDYTSFDRNTAIPETLFPTPEVLPPGEKSISILGGLKDKSKADGLRKSYMRAWGTIPRPVISDDAEEVDEDNIVYKPI